MLPWSHSSSPPVSASSHRPSRCSPAASGFAFAAAAVVSAFALMRLVSALGVGRLVNRFGPRVVLGTGIALVAGSSAVSGFAGTTASCWLCAAPVGSARRCSASRPCRCCLRQPERAARPGDGRVQRWFPARRGVGPALGGLITEWSLRAPFFIYAATLAAAGTGPGAAAAPPSACPSADEHHEATMTIAQAIRLPAFRAVALANLADNWAALGVRAAIVPLFVVESLHHSPLWTGIGFTVFTVANGAALLVAGRFADRSGRRPVLLAGCRAARPGAAC